METEIAWGLKNREFILHYQPKVNSGGDITGAEALIRWMSPSRGMIPPDQFLPIAEQTGLIQEIDRYVIEEVFRQIKIWTMNNIIRFPVAINLSPFSIENGNIVSDIQNSLQTFNLPPERLEFEIIESMQLIKVYETNIKIQAIREMGSQIAIDDFGTGYSSLSELIDYPVDILKMDKSFIKELGKDSKVEIMVESIVSLSRKLGLKVVAEGVKRKINTRF